MSFEPSEAPTTELPNENGLTRQMGTGVQEEDGFTGERRFRMHWIHNRSSVGTPHMPVQEQNRLVKKKTLINKEIKRTSNGDFQRRFLIKNSRRFILHRLCALDMSRSPPNKTRLYQTRSVTRRIIFRARKWIGNSQRRRWT